MRKSRLIILPVLSMILAGCGKMITLNFDEGKDISYSVTKGELGDFSLIAPENNFVVGAQPTFTWTASQNALHYTLEVCSSNTFDNNSNSIIYLKETNIDATSFKLSGSLKQKNIDYYWRVTAINEYNSKAVGKEKTSEVRKFNYHIEGSGEVDIGVGETGDWALHEVGSYADISVDHNDFFGTGDQDSLKITFEKEDTYQGPGHEKSDGWLSVQKTVEMDVFGPDAFYCNFYYMGHDSTILIRIIDQDGELWYKYVKFTQDSRQIILLRFDQFVLRTGDTVVQNQTFDYEHIQAVEVCFEKTFGDGCCIVGGLKAVKYEDYKDLFITKLNFNSVPLDKWINESYTFTKNISEDGYELSLTYGSDIGNNSSQGYGFAKIPVDKYFSDGNAIKVKIKFTSASIGTTNSIIRIYEPDNDRWSSTHPYKILSSDEYTEFTIPFMAWDQSNISEGKRQFYKISQIQFGLNNCYASGTIYYKDFEIVTVPDVSENKREVGNDGLIENFDSYVYREELYEYWETSLDNKDEGIYLETDKKQRGAGNIQAGKFTYKSDMFMAHYDMYLDVKVNDLNGIKFWIKDDSKKSDKSVFNSLKDEQIAAKATFQVALDDGRWYRYIIPQLPRLWTEYTIKFTDFTLYSGKEYDTSEPVVSQHVINFAFGFEYRYYYNGKEYPVYTQLNPVYLDNIMFVNADQTDSVTIEQRLHPDANKVTTLDNFEYQNGEGIDDYWTGLNKQDYEVFALSNDVSSQGGSHSMKLDYQGSSSPSYANYPLMGNDVECKALQLDIKGDGKSRIFVNFYLRIDGNLKQYRATIETPAASWNRYVLGIDSTIFVPQNGGSALTKDSLVNLERFTFGIVAASGSARSSNYVDNIKFVFKDVGYTTRTVTEIPEE